MNGFAVQIYLATCVLRYSALPTYSIFNGVPFFAQAHLPSKEAVSTIKQKIYASKRAFNGNGLLNEEEHTTPTTSSLVP